MVHGCFSVCFSHRSVSDSTYTSFKLMTALFLLLEVHSMLD